MHGWSKKAPPLSQPTTVLGKREKPILAGMSLDAFPRRLRKVYILYTAQYIAIGFANR